MRIQLETVECDKQRARDAHHPVDHVLHDKNRLTKVVGGSVKVPHLLVGHEILRCCGQSIPLIVSAVAWGREGEARTLPAPRGTMTGMDERPLTAREAIPWMIPGSLIGAALGIGISAWGGWLRDVFIMPFILGVTGAVGSVIGMKIAHVRRRKRP